MFAPILLLRPTRIGPRIFASAPTITLGSEFGYPLGRLDPTRSDLRSLRIMPWPKEQSPSITALPLIIEPYPYTITIPGSRSAW